MKKLRRLHVILLGSILGIAAAVGAFFLLLKPQSVAIAAKQSDYTNKEGIAQTIPTKQNDLVKAKSDVKIAKRRLLTYSKRYHKIHFEHASGDWDALFDLWREYREQMGPKFIKFVESTGCRLLSGISMPAPPLTPVPPPANGFIQVPETGSFNVTVGGGLPQIFTLLKKLPSFEYLNAIGPVSIQGTSPRLTASFSIAFFIVADMSEKAKESASVTITMQGPGASAPGGGPPGAAPSGPAAGPPGKSKAGPEAAGKIPTGTQGGRRESTGGGGVGKRGGKGADAD